MGVSAYTSIYKDSLQRGFLLRYKSPRGQDFTSLMEEDVIVTHPILHLKKTASYTYMHIYTAYTALEKK